MAKMPAAPLVRRVLYLLAALLPVWAVIAFFTGGVGWMLGPIRLSSRQPVRPLLIGLGIAAWYVWKYSRTERDVDDTVSPRACVAAIVGLTFLSYLFYARFEHWFHLRFLLPAYPVLFVLLAAGMRWVALRLPVETRVPAAALVCAVMIPVGVNIARREGVFNVAPSEQRHIRAANEVAARTPADAIVLAVQHSGSVRYYANRITLRYDWLKDGALDMALRDVAAKGHRAYLVVDDWEEKEFRARFAPANRAGRLDWPPVARVSGSPEVHIFEMQDGGPAPTQ